MGMADIVSEYMCGGIISIGDGRVRESDGLGYSIGIPICNILRLK